MVAPPDIDGLPPAELKQLLLKLLEENAEQKRLICGAARGDRAAERAEGPAADQAEWHGERNLAEARRQARPVAAAAARSTPRVNVEEQILKAEVPAGSRFKGYEDFVVQDLVLRVRVIRYRRERWVTPDGRTVIAPLPPGVRGHFGPELRRFVLVQYHQGQVTVPRLLAQLQAIGVSHLEAAAHATADRRAGRVPGRSA